MEPVPVELGAPCAGTASFGAAWSSQSQRWHAGISEQLSIISPQASSSVSQVFIPQRWGEKGTVKQGIAHAQVPEPPS